MIIFFERMCFIMKKVLGLSMMVAVMAAGSAFAASTPVTNFTPGTAKANVEYSFLQDASGIGGHQDGYGASLEAGITNKWAVQYAYSNVNLPVKDLQDHQLAGVYKVNKNFNAYGALTYVDNGDSSTGVQFGVIGHMPLAAGWDGFAKIGFGNDIKQTYQIGASHALTENLNFNVYYQYDKYDYKDIEGSIKGFHAGVGLKF